MDDEFEGVVEKDITITQSARCTLEYGESHKGYWNCDKFIIQMEAVAEVGYPKRNVI